MSPKVIIMAIVYATIGLRWAAFLSTSHSHIIPPQFCYLTYISPWKCITLAQEIPIGVGGALLPTLKNTRALESLGTIVTPCICGLQIPQQCLPPRSLSAAQNQEGGMRGKWDFAKSMITLNAPLALGWNAQSISYLDHDSDCAHFIEIHCNALLNLEPLNPQWLSYVFLSGDFSLDFLLKNHEGS